MNYILALDEGTTSARAILYDEKLNIIAISQHEFLQIYPESGWVEQDATAVYAAQYSAMTECIAKSNVDMNDLKAIGITNQRETTVLWDKNTGKPIANAIVWQCRRTADYCDELIAKGYDEIIRKKTGLRIDPYFSGTKIRWLLNHIEGAREKAERGELLFGTIDTWLLWKLTNGKVHATDKTNASRTMLYNLEKEDWDDDLLNLMDIPRNMMPEIKASGELYGTVNLMGKEIPIAGVVGDQQSALFGQGCFHKGEGKSTYGTGCFLLTHIGNEIIQSKNGLLTTVAAGIKGEPQEYALEGSVFIGGALIQWLRTEMGLLQEARDSEYFANKVPDTNGVYIVPAFAGLGAPYWDADARGMIVGLSRGSNRCHIIRAALEAIAFQTEDLIHSMNQDMNFAMQSLKVDGGASKNCLLMQMQADFSNIQVIRSGNSEATARGAAALAALTVGIFHSKEEFAAKLCEGKVFSPQISEEERKEKIDGWKEAVLSCRGYKYGN